MNISKEIELSPHTLRRAFATYHAEKGMPLPLLQKLLGHASIRTTALYWQDIHGNGDNDDTADILAGKKWLEGRGRQIFPKTPVETPITETFPKMPKTPKPIFIDKRPAIIKQKPTKPSNYLSPTKISTKVNEIQLIIPEKVIFLESKENNQLEINRQLSLNTSKSEGITDKEQILLEKIKSLEEQLKRVQNENKVLKTENKHLKELVQKDQETESKVIQSLPFK